MRELALNEQRILEVLHETAYAEHGSALEMLAACKASTRNSLVYGYFEHAKDEYNHVKTFLSILSSRTKGLSSESVRGFRFSHLGLISKGYISRKGNLVEIMNNKDFIGLEVKFKFCFKNTSMKFFLEKIFIS